MLDIIIDTILDALKLIPFLFVAFLLLEFIEHKLSNKNKDKIAKAGRLGPLLGSLLGAIPQCGFGSMATNLYAGRVITLGTLISIYLSTSDEMLPIMLSHEVELSLIIRILITKVVIGMICGFVIDLIIRKKEEVHIEELCHDEHCDCEHGILKSSIKHTLHTILFIMLISFVLNILLEYFGDDISLKDNIFGPFLSSLVGLIPNCGASVIITESYLEGYLSYGALIAGLLTNSGVALLLLFKVNKNIKENIGILLTLYLIGALIGVILMLI